MRAPKLVTTVYGKRYVGMLLTLLESIRAIGRHVAAEVYWQDLPSEEVGAIRDAYPWAAFVETSFDFSADHVKRISSKTLMWTYALGRQKDGEVICLLDVDTIVIKDLEHFCEAMTEDVLFTAKNEQFELNSGVMIIKASERTRRFLRKWEIATSAILRDDASLSIANSPQHPYGGADQMSLHQLLGFKSGTECYEVDVGCGVVRARSVPTAVLNETNSVPISSRTHIIHYKGGWQRVLLDGRRFTKNRPQQSSDEMHQEYLRHFNAGLERVKCTSRRAWTELMFGIRQPWWVKRSSSQKRRAAYVIYVVWDLIRDMVRVAAKRVSNLRVRGVR